MCLYEENLLFSDNQFKNRSLWHSEIFIFSGISGLLPGFGSRMGYLSYYTAKSLVKMRSFEESCHYLKELHFSL